MSQSVETRSPFVAPARPGSSSEADQPVASDPTGAVAETNAEDSLFERLSWLYVFFREKLFRDDTERFVRALWPDSNPPAGTRLIELGCGPGFYSCQFASRFLQLSVLGVDRSARQLDCALTKARSLGLQNCRFSSDNVLDLSHADETFDVVIAARLFTVLPDQKRAIAEMYRVLRPGGRCLIAEPRYKIWASLPLLAMWLLAGITGMNNGCREPSKANVLKPAAFEKLFASQPWRKMKTWQDGRYQYALCEKV